MRILRRTPPYRSPDLGAKILAAWLLVSSSLLLVSGLIALSGCGEKMDIFRPVGLFSVSRYLEDAVYSDSDAVQLVVIGGSLYVLTGDGRLTKRDRNYGEIAVVEGLADPTALCSDEAGELVFVWERSAGRISAYRTSDLFLVGATDLDSLVKSVTSLVACRTGIDGDPHVAGARTFLYMADPDSGVIHRHVYDDFSGLSPYGILARSDGDGARFVHRPAGMTQDRDGMLLVCDADTSRNWVIRFDPTPDFTDTTPDTNDQDPWRGRAIVFDLETCVPPAAVDFTLGDAAECGETGWSGAPSTDEGEFFRPVDATLDGSHRIYVLDSGNDRIQIFTHEGYYVMLFGSTEMTPGPISIGVVDVRTGSGAEAVNFGAYVFVLVPQLQQVRKLISAEQYIFINQEPPPDPG